MSIGPPNNVRDERTGKVEKIVVDNEAEFRVSEELVENEVLVLVNRRHDLNEFANGELVATFIWDFNEQEVLSMQYERNPD